jgi:hypothetical protein
MTEETVLNTTQGLISRQWVDDLWSNADVIINRIIRANSVRVMLLRARF